MATSNPSSERSTRAPRSHQRARSPVPTPAGALPAAIRYKTHESPDFIVSPLSPSAPMALASAANPCAMGFPSSRVPWVPEHDRQQHPYATPVELRHHLAQAGQAARHVAPKIELVAIIDADVRVGRPDQYAVDAAIPIREVRQIAFDGIMSASRDHKNSARAPSSAAG